MYELHVYGRGNPIHLMSVSGHDIFTAYSMFFQDAERSLSKTMLQITESGSMIDPRRGVNAQVTSYDATVFVNYTEKDIYLTEMLSRLNLATPSIPPRRRPGRVRYCLMMLKLACLAVFTGRQLPPVVATFSDPRWLLNVYRMMRSDEKDHTAHARIAVEHRLWDFGLSEELRKLYPEEQ